MNYMRLLVVLLSYTLLQAAALSPELQASALSVETPYMCEDVVGVAVSTSRPKAQAYIARSVDLETQYFALTCVYSYDSRCFSVSELEVLAQRVDEYKERPLEDIFKMLKKESDEHILNQVATHKVAFVRLYNNLLERIFVERYSHVRTSIPFSNSPDLLLIQDSMITSLYGDTHQAPVQKRAENALSAHPEKALHIVVDVNRWKKLIQQHTS